MKIDLTKQQCFDIKWSILIALDTVIKERKKEKKEVESHLEKRLTELHDCIQKQEEQMTKLGY